MRWYVNGTQRGPCVPRHGRKNWWNIWFFSTLKRSLLISDRTRGYMWSLFIFSIASPIWMGIWLVGSNINCNYAKYNAFRVYWRPCSHSEFRWYRNEATEIIAKSCEFMSSSSHAEQKKIWKFVLSLSLVHAPLRLQAEYNQKIIWQVTSNYKHEIIDSIVVPPSVYQTRYMNGNARHSKISRPAYVSSSRIFISKSNTKFTYFSSQWSSAF